MSRGLALLGLAALVLVPAASGSAARSVLPASGAKLRAAYGKLPLAFVENRGQTDARIRYQAEAAGASFSFTETSALFSFTEGRKRVALELSFAGGNRSPRIEAAGALPGRLNYFIGKDPAKWRAGLRTYDEIVYRDVWPGVDVAFHGNASRLKYEFRVAPGADASAIRLRYGGAERLSLGRAGGLRIHTSLGVLRDSRPVSYQTEAGRRMPVKSAYSLTGGRGYGFSVGAYDHRRPLVIDPGIAYSRFLGGAFIDIGRAIAVDADGNAYATGLFGSNQAFVTRLDAAGTVVYTTVFGGSLGDDGLGIAVDTDGNALVTGKTQSANFPTTEDAVDRSHNGSWDAFVTKLNPAGAIVYSTYLGGEFLDEGHAIGVDAVGNAHVTGETHSFGFPATPGAYDTTYGGCCPGFSGPANIFVTKVNPAGSALVYSTFLGPIGVGSGIAVDAGANAYVASTADHNGIADVSMTKLNPAGSGLVYSTFIPGTDRATGTAVDADGNAYVTGWIGPGSTGFPLVNAFDTSQSAAAYEGFVTKLNAAGSAFIYSTYLGGSPGGSSGVEEGAGIAVDAGGNAYVTGRTDSVDFPTTPGALDTTKNNAGHDAFVTKLGASGSLAYSTFLPATLSWGHGIAVDGGGNAYAAGERDNSGTVDIFVVKLGTAPAPATLTLSPASGVNEVGEEHCVTATVADQVGNPVADVSVVFSVSGANSAAGAQKTNASGQATFCYTGTAAGEDAIKAFADADGDGAQDTDEPSGAATKTYLAVIEPDEADLSVFLRVDNERPTVGDEVTFVLDVRNSGPLAVPIDTASTQTELQIGGILWEVVAGSVSASQGVATFTTGSNFPTMTWRPVAGELLPAGATARLVWRARLLLAGFRTPVLAQVGTAALFDPDSTPGNCDPDGSFIRADLEDDCGGVTLTPLPAIPPIITCTVPDGAVWYGVDVQVPCTATDPDTGLADPADASFVLTTSAATGTESSNVATGTREVCDKSGNCSTAGPYTFRVDKKAPQAGFCEAPDGAWHADDVTLHCAYADGGAGPASQSVSLTTSVDAGSETNDAAASAGGAQACDVVGNCAPSPADISSNKVDRKAPTVTCKAASFTLNQSAAIVTGIATDGGSGPDYQIVSAAADVFSAGLKSVTLTASDDVGNASTKSCPYSVGYSFSGFLAPVNDPNTVNLGKAGRTYSIKWQLRDANGNFVSTLAAVSSITYKAAACSSFTSDPTDALETSTTGGTILRYDSTANQYVYNWATPTAAGCYTLLVNLVGGQVFPAYFNLS
jgi:hypothetical protein